MSTPQRPVVVVGGGVSGLAAASRLAEAGRRVLLLEAGPALGGRARSFVDRTTGCAVDNGQHALMGCYTEFLSLLDRVGQRHALTIGEPRIPFWSAAGGIREFACPRLPAPLHFAAGLLRYGHLSIRERLSVAFAGRQWVTLSPGERTVAEQLDAMGQGANARSAFWDPVIWATLNASPEESSAKLLQSVVKRALLGSYEDSCFLLPTLPLSELYAEPAQKFIEERGGEVRCRIGVDAIERRGGELEVVAQGEAIAAKAVVLAVPPAALARMDPAPLRPSPELQRATPIVSGTLWLDRSLDPEVPAFCGLIDCNTQWLFRVDRLHATNPTASQPGERIACVRSGAREWTHMPRTEIAEQMWADVQRAIPSARQARVLNTLVVKEMAATLAPNPELQSHRPKAKTALPGVWLAGDWTDTGLPATLEGAAQSGHVAAEHILAEAL